MTNLFSGDTCDQREPAESAEMLLLSEKAGKVVQADSGLRREIFQRTDLTYVRTFGIRYGILFQAQTNAAGIPQNNGEMSDSNLRA